jgi:hypothetical protein
MVSVNFNNNVKVYQSGGINKIETTHLPAQVATVSSPISPAPTPSFKAEPYRTTMTIRTQLVTDDEKKKFKEISEVLDGKYHAVNVECPNHDCEKVGWVTIGSSKQIVCVPNEIYIMQSDVIDTVD